MIDDEVLETVRAATLEPEEGGAEADGQAEGPVDDTAGRIAELERQLSERDRQVVKLERDVKARDGRIAKLEKAKASPVKKVAEKPEAATPATGAEPLEKPETPLAGE